MAKQRCNGLVVERAAYDAEVGGRVRAARGVYEAGLYTWPTG